MNKQSRFRTGLGFGIFLTIFFLLRYLLPAENLSGRQIFAIILTAVLTGVLGGILFTWLIGVIFRKTLNVKVDLEPGETVAFESAASNFKGIEAVGGKLVLTSRRLIFKPHKLNIQKHPLSLDLDEIENVSRFKKLGLINNGLSVTASNNRIISFSVEKAEEWLALLSRLKENQSPG